MLKILSTVRGALLIACLTVQFSIDAFSQEQQTQPREVQGHQQQETEPPQQLEFRQDVAPQGALVVSLGKDSPAVGRDAYVTFSLSTIEAVKVGKIVSEISFPNTGELELDRAELTPDMKMAGATLEVEKGPSGGLDVVLKLTITAKEPILDGILANLIFKVVNRPTGDRFPGEEQKIALNNRAAAWTLDGQQIDVVTSEPGEVDFEYAPVVFACFFYMH